MYHPLEDLFRQVFEGHHPNMRKLQSAFGEIHRD
jgi:hypothetical protein